jgi:hypothetical protein
MQSNFIFHTLLCSAVRSPKKTGTESAKLNENIYTHNVSLSLTFSGEEGKNR